MFGISLSKDQVPDAMDLLKKDHAEVDDLFEEFESIKATATDKEKRDISAMICEALTIHATIEEEIFYPQARGFDADLDDLLNEAAVEHQSLKDIIERLQAAPASDRLFDAGVKVLSEYVKHHVEEEENELFPKVKKSGIDLLALGRELQKRKDELTATGASSRPARASNKRSNSSPEMNDR